MFLYFLFTVAWMTFFTLYYVEKQIKSNNYPWALPCSFGVLVFIALTYAAARFGQLKGKEEMNELRKFAEDVRDVMAIENTGKYKGKYLVLGGKISPMEGIGPSQLRIGSVEKKLNEGVVKELIFALSATMEGDTTAYYIYKKFKGFQVMFSSIARGIAVGDELEYADEISLGRSITNRIAYNEAG